MIILASSSPRRRELLKYITEDFTVKTADVEENYDRTLSPAGVVEYLSRIKAEPFRNGSDIVIGSDTVVALGKKILGKPESKAQAFEMLSFLRGRTHSVFTGVTLIGGNRTKTFHCETKVRFYNVSDEDIKKYVETGEPMDKAGAYGLQGRGAFLAEKIDGDFFNVVGLPISRLKIELDKIKKELKYD